jgi:hypothetical protein
MQAYVSDETSPEQRERVRRYLESDEFGCELARKIGVAGIRLATDPGKGFDVDPDTGPDPEKPARVRKMLLEFSTGFISNTESPIRQARPDLPGAIIGAVLGGGKRKEPLDPDSPNMSSTLDSRLNEEFGGAARRRRALGQEYPLEGDPGWTGAEAVLLEALDESERREREGSRLISLGRDAGLSERDIEIVRLSEVESLNAPKIAEQFGMTAAAVRKVLSRARSRLEG